MDFLIYATDIAEKIILLLLFGLSIWSISIIIDRYRIIQWQRKNAPFMELKSKIKKQELITLKNEIPTEEKSEEKIPLLRGAANALVSAHQNTEAINAALSGYIKEEKMKLDQGLAVLATLGSNAPFIGLFGTVLGIIRSFAYLGAQSGTASVMSGISQALFATAFGLFVAIPAVIAFNIFTKSIKDLVIKAETFT